MEKCFNKSCEDFHNNAAGHCRRYAVGKEDKCPDIIDENGYVKKGGYPKIAIFSEAIDWMEQGNKVVCAHKHTLSITKNGHIIAGHTESIYPLGLDDIKGLWKLLAPEKESVQDDKKEIIRLLEKIIKMCEIKK